MGRGTLWLALLLAACGDVDPPADASRDAGGGDADVVLRSVAAPAPPAPPALPVLTPCPPGWREASHPTLPELSLCEPFSGEEPEPCEPHELHVPGTPGCVIAGAACPAGEWPEGLPAGAAIRYVRAGASPGGTGSRDAPLSTIGEALAGAAPGDVVAIATGTYVEVIRAPAADVTLWGACAERTRIAGAPTPPLLGTINVASTGIVLRNLEIGGEGFAVWAHDGAAVTLAGVVIAGAAGSGLYAGGDASITAEDIVVRDTRSSAAGAGRGIEVTRGASGTIGRALVEGNAEAAVFASDAGSTLTLSDAVVRSSGARGNENAVALRGATLDVRRSVLYPMDRAGFLALENAHLRASDVIVRGRGCGLCAGGAAYSGATLELARVWISDTSPFGITTDADGTTVTLTDLVIERTSPSAMIVSSVAVAASAGATVQIDRGAFFDNSGSLGSHGAGAQLLANDITSIDRPEAPSLSGIVYTSTGGSAVIQRLRGMGARFSALRVETESHLVVRDADFSNLLPRANDDRGGMALFADQAGFVETERMRVVGAVEVGIYIDEPDTRWIGTDVEVHDTVPRADGIWGRGIQVQRGASAELTRASVTASRGVGVCLASGQLDARSFVITDTERDPCSLDVCYRLGTGLVVAVGSTATLDDFVLARNADIGLQLSHDGQADLRDGDVAFHPIGVNVQNADLSPDRLSNGVRYFANTRDLDSAELPVPDPETGL